MLHDWRQWQLLWTRAIVFRRDDFADVKNNTGIDQATLIVDRNSADIAYTFWFYVCLNLRDRNWCSAADGSVSWHWFAPSFYEDTKNITGDDQDQSKFQNNPIYAYAIKQDLSKNIFLLLGRQHYDAIGRSGKEQGDTAEQRNYRG